MIELIGSKVFDEAYSILKNKLKENKKYFTVIKEDIQSALQSHLKFVDNWSKEVQIRDMTEAKKVDKIYVGLDINVVPKNNTTSVSETEKKSILKIINTENHIILLGDTGAGKTTTLKYLCRELMYTDKKAFDEYKAPVVILLRTLGEDESIYERLASILGLNLFIENENFTNLNIANRSEALLKKVVNSYADSLKLLILIDGLDEIEPFKLKNINSELRELTSNLKDSKIILTCRSGAFRIVINNTKSYEICPLSKNQKIKFCKNWFVNKDKYLDFLNVLNHSPLKDTSDRPLILTLLCTLYNKYSRLPDKPKFVYNKIIRLLIEEWDAQREINRTPNYEIIEGDKIFDFLIQFAFELTANYSHKSYSYENVVYIFEELMENFELPKKELETFLLDVEAQNGIFIKSSYETYEFAHKSIQEYLTAEYIIRLPNIPIKLVNDYNLLNELAIAVCLSSNPTIYFCNLIFNVFDSNKQTHYEYENDEDDDLVDGSYKPLQIFLNRVFLEKPDFEINALLGYALLYIYHVWWLEKPETPNDPNLNRYFGNDNYYYLELLEDFLEFEPIKKSLKLCIKNIRFKNDSINQETNAEEKIDYSLLEEYNINELLVRIELTDNLYLRNFNTKIPNHIFITKDIIELLKGHKLLTP